jgi:hypothetical protein
VQGQYPAREIVEVPNVVGLPASEAFWQVVRPWTQLIPVLGALNQTRFDGREELVAVDQRPAGGSRRPMNDIVVISLGSRPRQVTLRLAAPADTPAPEVVGMELEQAIDAVVARGLVANIVPPEARIAVHLPVMRQEPSPGKPVDHGHVRLFLDEPPAARGGSGATAFEYAIRFGSATSLLTIDSASARLTATCLEDALGDLLAALGRLASGARSARLAWQEEPGEHRWLLERRNTQVSVVVRRFEDSYYPGPDDDGGIVLAAQCALRDLVAAVCGAARELLETHGMVGYRRLWHNHDFPLTTLEALERWLAED